MRLTVLVILGMAACGDPMLPESGVALHATIDGAIDAAPTTDGSPPFIPVHVLPGTMISGAPDITVSASQSIIDTSALTIDGATNPYFVRQGNYAVLFTGAFAVQGSVMIQGTSPLIVVANDRVTVSANIELGATGNVPGAGAASSGPGAGGPGASTYHIDVRWSSGGGGGSHGTLGGPGGTFDATAIPAGTNGASYGISPDAPLIGGSPGGHGGFGEGAAGGGGGALQISSAVSISILAELHAGGGGGTGGGVGSVGGGGGGAGGEILLESPMIRISGALMANGGGGGGGGSGDAGPPGTAGRDGAGLTPAAGGTGGIPQGCDGGRGAVFGDASPGKGQPNSKGGGGGGGAGRIWLRYRAATAPDLSGAAISPLAGMDPTLP